MNLFRSIVVVLALVMAAGSTMPAFIMARANTDISPCHSGQSMDMDDDIALAMQISRETKASSSEKPNDSHPQSECQMEHVGISIDAIAIPSPLFHILYEVGLSSASAVYATISANNILAFNTHAPPDILIGTRPSDALVKVFKHQII